MGDPLVILATAVVLAWIAFVLFVCLVRWVIRREIKRALRRLGELHLIRRDGKGRFCK